MKIFAILVLSLFTTFNLTSQMIEDSVAFYGNEWIDFNKEYYKLPVSEDGIYHISFQQLKGAGIDMNNVEGKDFQLYLYGKEINIYTSTSGKFSSNDFIEFYGKKNRSKLDSFLFRNKNDLLNPEYSMFNDTASYFLTWDKSKVNKRYTSLDNNLDGTLPPAEKYYIHDEKFVYNSHFIKPLRDSKNHIQKSSFDVGEGYGSSNTGVKNSFTIATSNYFKTNIKPVLSIRYATNLGKHIIDIKVNDLFKKQVKKSGLYCGNIDVELDENDIKGEMAVTLEGTFNSDYKDRRSVSVIEMKYPRSFDFQNKSLFSFNIDANPFTEYFEINNFDINGGSFVLYDIANGTRLIPKVDNNLVKFILKPQNSSYKFVLANLDKSVKTIQSLKKVEFVDYLQDKDKNYIIVSDKDKFVDESNTNWVEEYAGYRSSTQGGSYKTLLVNINNIYNQFGYGIDRHNIALNNFIIYLKDHFINPEYIFIIGKGLEYNEMRTASLIDENKDLYIVPTFGYPGSDNLLAARFNKNYAEIPIGRIAVKNHQQIQTYLNKVKKHEDYLQYSQTIEDKEWMKKVIHLVGGTADIIDQIELNLKRMSKIIKYNKFGGETHTYKRTSGDAQESVSKKIIHDINSGASIVTFYGHSGITGTDFNISNLENDKFPVFFSLGCYSGNIHTNIKDGQSEEFVLDDYGVIAYIGTSGTGFTGSLGSLGKKIYEYIGNTHYGEGMGKIVHDAIKVLAQNNSDIGTVTLNQQFTFHGDPAILLNNHPGPDYLIDYSTVTTSPNVINSNINNFDLRFDIVNIGLAIDDSIAVKVIRKYPSGDVDTTFAKLESIRGRSTVSIKLATNGIDGIGENCVSVYLDPYNTIEELPSPDAEDNNQLSDQNGDNKFCFYIINNGAKPIYPEEFSIITKKDIALQASSYNYFIGSQKYIFQIDTTEEFNSPILKMTTVTSNGGIVEWTPDVDYTHETVYYWRISSDTTNTNLKPLWLNSSFIYLNTQSDIEGWNQSHYFQYLKDDFEGTVFDGRKFDFISRKYNIKIIGKKYEPTNRKVFFVDGDGWGDLNNNPKPSIVITGWGPDSWLRNNSGHDFNSMPNSQPYKLQFVYNPKIKEQRAGIKDLLESVPDSMTVFLFTLLGNENQSIEPEKWAEDSISIGYNLFSVLESYGAKKIRLMETKGTVPYVFVFKKGAGVIAERIGKTINDVFEINTEVLLNEPRGKFFSTLIGPAKKWNKFLWNEEETGDLTEYSYIKVHKLGKDLFEDIVIDSLVKNEELDLSSIDPKLYPYLKLEFFAYDRFKRDPPKINFWRVLYKGFPDAILYNKGDGYFYKDTLEFGDVFKFKTNILNNTSIDMDSLDVKFKIKKRNNEEIVVNKRYPKLLKNSSYSVEFEYPTSELQGMNEFTIEVNPDRTIQEKYYFNNIGIRRFYVRKDNENPLMEVTFNGKHIMDGDLINPRAEISIMLRDNNKFLLLNNKSIFQKLTIISPSGVISDIDINDDSEIEFVPAESLENNVAKLIFRHDFFDEEGEYQLIAQAADISGNLSGENEYKISFTINLKEEISNVYNYPNPFSTKTKFIFKLSGKDVPDRIIIKIMTLSGKIVRELTNVDLGDLDISEYNSTNYWDGTDEFGRKLANGIYLYQVKAVTAEGKEYNVLDNEFFKKGFGKLVILR